MVRRRPVKSRAKRLIVDFGSYFDEKEEHWKNRKDYPYKHLDIITSKKYSLEELETLYYLIRIFSEKLYSPSYNQIYLDIKEESKKINQNEKMKFVFLRSGKTDLEKHIIKLGVKTKRNSKGKNILIYHEYGKESFVHKRLNIRKKLELPPSGHCKYLVLNVKKLEKDVGFKLNEFYLIITYLVLKKNLRKSIGEANKLCKKCENYLERLHKREEEVLKENAGL